MDHRREIVAVELPGKSYGRAVVYDVRGDVTQSTARLSEGVLRDVRLTGDQVFIAEILPQK